MFLKPAKIKNSIVRQPFPWNAAELFERDPVFITKAPAIQHYWSLAEGGQLQKPKTTELRLKPSGLNIKRNKTCIIERGQILDALEDFHAW
jgi:hypothetical protein